jgi:hypothetical protein
VTTAIVEVLDELAAAVADLKGILAAEKPAAPLPVLPLCRIAIDAQHAACLLRQHADLLKNAQAPAAGPNSRGGAGVRAVKEGGTNVATKPIRWHAWLRVGRTWRCLCTSRTRAQASACLLAAAARTGSRSPVRLALVGGARALWYEFKK